MILSQLLAQTARQNAARPAFRYGGQEILFSDILRRVSQLSYLYHADLGAAEKGARIALLADNSPSVALTFVALTNIRVLTIPLSPTLRPEELGHCLRQSGATHLGVSADRLAQARELLRTERLALPLIEIERKQGGEYSASYAPPAENPPRDLDPILYLRTAGVGGEARFVAFDHRGLVHVPQALRRLYRLEGAERIFTPLNWSHPFAWVHAMLLPLLGGATSVVGPPLEGAELAQFLGENEVTRLLLDAASARALLATGTRFPHLKGLVVGLGGTPSALQELRALATPLGIPVFASYGQAETLWSVALEGPEGDSSVAKSATLQGLKLKVLDGNGDEILRKAKGKTGALAISGPSIMVGYRGGDKKEAESATRSVIRGSWYHTGDVVHLTGDGETLRLGYLGRSEEMLRAEKGAAEKTGEDGFISPEPVDRVARACVGVQDAAGFVCKDARGKPHLACAAVRAPGSTVTAEAVLAQCRSAFAGAQVPEAVFFVDDLPRMPIGGQVNRLLLSRQFNGASPSSSPSVPAPVSSSSVPAALLGEYVACDLSEIHTNVMLPVTVHVYYKDKMLAFRGPGEVIDRHTYERLELKKYGTLYIQAGEAAKLRAWSENLDATSAKETSELGRADPALLVARQEAHRELLKMFQTAGDPKLAARAMEVNRKLFQEVAKSGLAVRPLADLRAHSKGTAEHSVNVSVLSVYLALNLGYSHEGILKSVGLGALLHDLGKVKLHLDDGAAPEAQEKEFRRHPSTGVESLMGDDQIPREVKLIVEQHHEFSDGSGYPRGLRGSQIYDLAGIVAIANVFENLVSDDTTPDIRERYGHAMRKLEKEYFKRLDPYKLEKCLRILELSKKA